MSEAEKDSILEQAARAYADRHDGTSRDAARTRARILASADRDRRRTVFAMAAAAVLALGLGLPTAWAWSTGALDAWLGGAGEEREEPAAEDEAPEAAVSEPIAVEAPTEPEVIEPEVIEPEVIEPEVIEEAVVAEPAIVPAPIAPRVDGEPDDDADPEEGPPVDPAERRAYRAAHALHFDARDPAGAIEAWDRYLEEYPSGRFAIEARYNRALCLVRLDRHEEARAALAAFAEGRHGEYRRREASALIEALSE